MFSVDVRTATARVKRLPVKLRRDRNLIPEDDAALARRRRLTVIRRVVVGLWAAVVIYRIATQGVPFRPDLVLLYTCTGLAAASIGRRNAWLVIRDWLPFALVPLAYGWTRDLRDLVGIPTLWKLPVDADQWMFFGTVPTVWLQEHIKMAQPPWWEVAIGTVYMSYFILPYVVAAVLWLRNREEFKAFARRFVALALSAYVLYVLMPAAPPWAAARCTDADVSGGPPDPDCMFRYPADVPDGGLLGGMQTVQSGANGFVERISSRGWATLHLDAARALIDLGQSNVNLVAAVPSLHAGMSGMIAVFLWHRVRPNWRPLLAVYALMMAFSLVYSAEHYVIDIVLGWALAAVVMVACSRWEARRATKAALREVATHEPLDDEADEPAGRPTDEPDVVPA